MYRALYIIILTSLIHVSGVCQEPLPAVIDKDTILTAEGSPYYIQQNLSINDSITLKINQGTTIILAEGASIYNNGRLIIEGDEEEKVLFTSDSPETRWNYITNQGTLIASYLVLRRAIRFVSSYGDTLIVENCDVAETYRGDGDDCIGVHDANKVIIRNTSLTGNPGAEKTDAIDLDGISDDTISGNTITGYSDDGIDIGTNSTNIVVADNEISYCDMGISIGENSTALVYKNLLIYSNGGIQSHTGSVVDARLNTLYGNNHGIRAFHDTGEESSGGTITVSSSIISNSVLGDMIRVANSIVNAEYTLTDLILLPGTGNITGFPHFVDIDNGNFHLAQASDAIDAGDPDLDKDGSDYLVDVDDRDPDGSRLDMGSYPYFHSLDVRDVLRENYIHIYPNPVGEVICLEHNAKRGAKIRVDIFTLSGTQVRSTMFQAGGDRGTFIWQHQIVNPGAYIVRTMIQHPGHWRERSRLVIFD
ncbi:MAG: right-handed parallel beta-helix repeat-containing protein [Bacteroidota bacterium]|nr:right-handed parallel beta-helix repeat-containing protein [Bacteroidota bacterium]